MDFLKGTMHGIKLLYAGMNPATLSGAIDVVVVRQPDGTYKCSPFHVKFGKFNVWSPAEKAVKIWINGKMVPINMKLGPGGEAFFVQEVKKDDVDERAGESRKMILTSPIMMPKGNHPPRSRSENDGGEPPELDATTMLRDTDVDIDSPARPSTPTDADDVPNGDTPTDGDDGANADAEGGTPTDADASRTSGATQPSSANSIDGTALRGSTDGTDGSRSEGHGSPPRLWDDADDEGTVSPRHIKSVGCTRGGSDTPDKITEWKWGALPDDESENVGTTDSDATGSTAAGGNTTGVLLSTCGMSALERFHECRVDFAALNADPKSMVDDGNLVAMIDGVPYTWADAAPIVLSLVAFGKPLAEDTCEALAKGSQESAERRSWWPFSRRSSTGVSDSQDASGGEDNDSDNDNDERTPDNQGAHGASVPGSASVEEPGTEHGTQHVTHGTAGDADGELHTIPPLKDVGGAGRPGTGTPAYLKTLVLTSADLEKLNLHPGGNEAQFTVTSKMQGRATVSCNIYLWNHDENVVISDIDGTITKSDIMGHAASFIGKDWTQAGVAGLYTKISKNGYKFLYLTSRSIGHAPLTREYLKGIRQDGRTLPIGPCMFSPQNFLSSIHREVIARNPQEFKIACLQSILHLFPARAEGVPGPFVAGFGNRHTDEVSYEAVNIPSDRVFTVDPKGDLKVREGPNLKSSYTELKDWTDLFFPPTVTDDMRDRQIAAAEAVLTPRKFGSANFWTAERDFMLSTNVDADIEALLAAG
eukprot:m.484228 g.484228  ORF g.484228 m.484228 type:complete len:761 (+) comp21731_c0_seq8:295-2577(+)